MASNRRKKQNNRSRTAKNQGNPKPRIANIVSTVPAVATQVQSVSNQRDADHGGDKQMPDAQGTITWDFWLAAIVAAAAIVQAVVAAFQWNAMNQQNAEMLKQSIAAEGQLQQAVAATKYNEKMLAIMESEMRAVVIVGQPAMRALGGGMVSFDVPVRNTGKTEATITKWGFDIAHIESTSYYDIEKYFRDDYGNPIPMNDDSGVTIQPGGSRTRNTMIGSVGDDFVERVQSGKETVTAYGWIAYKDVFGEYEPKSWCLHFDAETKQWVPDPMQHNNP